MFLNLVVNACQAIGHQGRILVETEQQGPWVIASVEDDGPGIPPEMVDRIFDPFFTTKPLGEGCGLGLGISYQLVRKHDGDLVVRTNLGEGTRFSVRLPLRAQSRSESMPSSSTSASQGSSLTPGATRKGS